MQPVPEAIALREHLTKMEADGAAALGPCPNGIAEAYFDIALPAVPGHDSWVSRTLVVYPTNTSSATSKGAPLVIMLYGGGFQCGSIEQVLLPARAYALHFGAVVACPSYQLCPEHPFPASPTTAYRAAAWLSDVANLYEAVPGLRAAGVVVDLDPAQPNGGFVLSGVSAGGNLAAVIAGVLAARPDVQETLLLAGGRLPRFKAPLTGLFSCIPVLTTEETVPAQYSALLRSRVENADSPNLPTVWARRMLNLYGADARSPWFSPINLSEGDAFVAANHPAKVFLQACSADCLRDDAVIYKAWLEAAGITNTTLTMMEGYGHSAWVTTALASEEHRRALKKASLDGMAWLLGKEWEGDVDAVY